MFRTGAVVTLTLAALAASAVAQKDKAEKAEAKVYKTPQEVFDAIEVAEEKKDYKTFVECLSEKTQKQFAGLTAVMAIEGRRAAAATKDEKQREALLKQTKAGSAVLDKHGLTEKATKDVKFGESKKEFQAAMKMLDGLIKDPRAFLIEIAPTSAMFGDSKNAKSKLTDLKIDGDKATAVVVTSDDKDKKGKDRKEPVGFVKVKGSWRLDLDLEPTEEAKDKDKGK